MHNCKTCKYFDPAPQTQAPKSINGTVNMGACRLKPPVTMIVGMQQTVGGPTPAFAAIWPTVSEAEFCAEHPLEKVELAKLLGSAVKRHVLDDKPLDYNAAIGEFNRTPTPEEIEAMAKGCSSIKVTRRLDDQGGAGGTT